MIKRTVRDGVETFHAYCAVQFEDHRKVGEYGTREEAAEAVRDACAQLSHSLLHSVSCVEALMGIEPEHLAEDEIGNAYWLTMALRFELDGAKVTDSQAFTFLKHVMGEQALEYAELVGEKVHVYSYNQSGNSDVNEWLSPAEARAKYPDASSNAYPTDPSGRITHIPRGVVYVETYAARDLIPPKRSHKVAA